MTLTPRAPQVATSTQRLGDGVRVVTVKLPSNLLLALDAIADRWGVNRSEAIRVLIDREQEKHATAAA